MYLNKGLNNLNIQRGNCNLNKNQVVNLFGYTNNEKFEYKTIIR